MTRRYRRLFFYTLCVFFLAGASWLVLAAKGFVLNVPRRTVEGRGAIFLRITPPDATIYLDGLSYDTPSGIRQAQAFITNLLPGVHTIAVDKEGYHRWQKKLIVLPLTVTEENAVELFTRAPAIEPYPDKDIPFLEIDEAGRRLLSEGASSTLVLLNITRPKEGELIVAPDGTKVLIRTPHTLSVVWVEPERFNRSRERGDREVVIESRDTISDAVWLPDDGQHIIFAAGGKIKIAELDGRGGRNIVNFLEAADTHFFLDKSAGVIVYSDKSKLSKLHL